jgi:O-Antigen ligase
MNFTVTGYILVFIGVLVFIFCPKYLSKLTVFSVAFTATAIANFDSGFWFTPFQFFSILWMLNTVVTALIQRKIFISLNLRRSLKYLIFFAAIVYFSSFMPLLINGNITIFSPKLGDSSFSSLSFSARNLTTPLYVVFNIFYTILIINENLNFVLIKETLRFYLLSLSFASVWGLIQFASFFLGFDYPSYVFNTSTNAGGNQFNQLLFDVASTEGFIRISSVASEPSVLAQLLVSIVPVSFFALFFKSYFFSFLIDFSLIVLNITVLLISTSATAYSGMLFIVFYIFFILIFLKKINFKVFLRLLVLSIVLMCFFFYLSSTNTLVSSIVDGLLDKSSSGSGLERAKSISLAWSYFEQYPLLGVGWGSVTSFDLFVGILSSAGIFGLLSFTALILHPLKRILFNLFRLNQGSNKLANADKLSLTSGVLVSFFSLLSVQVISGFWSAYGYFWLCLGLYISLNIRSNYTAD